MMAGDGSSDSSLSNSGGVNMNRGNSKTKYTYLGGNENLGALGDRSVASGDAKNALRNRLLYGWQNTQGQETPGASGGAGRRAASIPTSGPSTPGSITPANPTPPTDGGGGTGGSGGGSRDNNAAMRAQEKGGDGLQSLLQMLGIVPDASVNNRGDDSPVGDGGSQEGVGGTGGGRPVPGGGGGGPGTGGSDSVPPPAGVPGGNRPPTGRWGEGPAQDPGGTGGNGGGTGGGTTKTPGTDWRGDTFARDQGLMKTYEDWQAGNRTPEEQAYYRDIMAQRGPTGNEANTRSVWDWAMSGAPTRDEQNVFDQYGRNAQKTPEQAYLQDLIKKRADGTATDLENSLLAKYDAFGGSKGYDDEQGRVMGWQRSGAPTGWEQQNLNVGTDLQKGMSAAEKQALTQEGMKTAKAGFDSARQGMQRRALSSGNSAGLYGAMTDMAGKESDTLGQQARKNVLDIGNENVRRQQIGTGIVSDEAAKLRGYQQQGINNFAGYDQLANANKQFSLQGQQGLANQLRQSAGQGIDQGQAFTNQLYAQNQNAANSQNQWLQQQRATQMQGAQGAQNWDAQQRQNDQANNAARSGYLGGSRELQRQGAAAMQGLYGESDPTADWGAAANVWRNPLEVYAENGGAGGGI